MKKILVLGYFGYNSNQLDGQTIKTRNIYKLVKVHTDKEIDFYDTENFKNHRLSIFCMFWKLIRCNTLLYLPAHNNLRVIFPVIYCFSVLFCFKIHYFVVGGWLREFLEHLPIHKYMLARIKSIHVETKQLKIELEEYYHYKNVDIFPNFRFFDFTPVTSVSDKLRLVFMARVQKMKGLDWIFHLADYIVKNKLEDRYSITFYGPITNEDRSYFESNINKYSFVVYKGALQPKEIYGVLNNYDIMLLPTHYYTEGLPGSVVDAYISGIPVIATEWKHSHEFIEDGYSGFIIPFVNGADCLINRVVEIEENRTLLKDLKKNVLNKRKEFLPPHIASIVL